MRQRLVKHHGLDDIKSRKKYWDWHYLNSQKSREHRGYSSEDARPEETKFANPDVLQESDAMYAINDEAKEVQRRVQKLLGIAKQILTEQQYKVFFFLTERTMTERQVAKVLGVSQPRVHALWETAREKLKRAYDERTV